MKPTAKRSRKKGLPPSTERVSAGRRFEAATVRFLEDRGYYIIKRNWWLDRWGEIDLFARDAGGRFVLIEVRGRISSRFRPVEMLSGAKRARLQRLANALSRMVKAGVRVEFVEWTGTRPQLYRLEP